MKFDCHTHRCSQCQEEWVCSNKYCNNDQLCGQCDLELFEEWAMEHGLIQPKDYNATQAD